MSDFESLMMAHDNLQRELADYKSMVSKDKHELIKANISKIKKIGELKDEIEVLRKIIKSDSQVYAKTLHQNKRYREVLHGILDLLNSRDWSKYDASALQDNIDDYITLKNGDLLEGESE